MAPRMFRAFGLAAVTMSLAILPQIASADGGSGGTVPPGFSDDSGDVTIYTTPAPVEIAPEIAYPTFTGFEQRLD